MTKTSQPSRAGRPRQLENMITRNILVSDEAVQAALKISESNPPSISSGVRKALRMFRDAPTPLPNFSKKEQEAEFKNTRSRNIVLDSQTHEIANRLGNGNTSAGVRLALNLLQERQAARERR